MRRKGFTLIELMIVVAIIAIIAAVAIPGLLRSRIGSNEASAMGSLKAILNGQEQFKTANCVDLNANGAGEYGYVEELGGLVACRTDNAGTQGGAQFTASPYIPRVLGNTDVVRGTGANNTTDKAGYHFICYLPEDVDPPVAAESTCPNPVSIPVSENRYIAYAYPQTAGRTGVRVFVIDPQGQPYSLANTANNIPTYDGALGAAGIPPFDAALNQAQPNIWGSFIDDGDQGGALTGQNWVPTG